MFSCITSVMCEPWLRNKWGTLFYSCCFYFQLLNYCFKMKIWCMDWLEVGKNMTVVYIMKLFSLLLDTDVNSVFSYITF